MRLRKRGDVYYTRYWEDGIRRERSTHCTDRKAAEARAAQWERDAVDPDHATARNATLNDAFALLLSDRRERACAIPARSSLASVAFYEQKAGHWLRLLGHDFPLTKLDARTVKQYISFRRSEPSRAPRKGESADSPRIARVSDHTISKELVALRAALKLAKPAGLFRGDIEAIIPVAFAPEYKPRERWLPVDEVMRLLAHLADDEAARVAWIVATSACWHETDLAERAHVSLDRSRVFIPGTKRQTRKRTVPIVTPWQRELLDYALAHAKGDGAKLFCPWPSPGQSLYWACRRAGIEHASFNDLRRTFAQWMRQEGVPLELLAPMMGHATTHMLQRVYGRLDADTLDARVRSALGCPTIAPPGGAKLADTEECADALESISTENAVNSSGPCAGRTRDQRIKSPSRLWPKPGKRLRPSRLGAIAAPPVPHPKTHRRPR